MFKKIKDGLLFGLGFLLIIGIAQAWNGLQADKGDNLTSAKWNELVDTINNNKVNYERCSVISPIKGNNYDCAGNVIGTNSISDLVNVYCSSGYKITGGGCQFNQANQNVRQSNTYGDNYWSCSSLSDIEQVTAICLKF